MRVEQSVLMVVHVDLQKWQRVKASGELPCQRVGASVCVWGKKAIVYGGSDKRCM